MSGVRRQILAEVQSTGKQHHDESSLKAKLSPASQMEEKARSIYAPNVPNGNDTQTYLGPNAKPAR